ncbi:cytochrome C oxidase subunit IV family protein [Piscinibacter sp.]|uniref:cytochrome C oxidase subunit IV family protein n=1 Tax=Piscinibacter sp. TaxID=1903157 RepID=UPI0039E632C2
MTMRILRRLSSQRIHLVWLGLVAATALSWEMGHGIGFDDVRHASVAILVVAFLKARFVILDFMELRHAPPAMRIAAEAWVVGVCALLVGLLLAAPAPP